MHTVHHLNISTCAQTDNLTYMFLFVFIIFRSHIDVVHILFDIFALPIVNHLKSDFEKHMETSTICRPKNLGTNIIQPATEPIASPTGLISTTILHPANAPGGGRHDESGRIL